MAALIKGNIVFLICV